MEYFLIIFAVVSSFFVVRLRVRMRPYTPPFCTPPDPPFLVRFLVGDGWCPGSTNKSLSLYFFYSLISFLKMLCDLHKKLRVFYVKILYFLHQFYSIKIYTQKTYKNYVKIWKTHPKKGQKTPSTAHSIGKNALFHAFWGLTKSSKTVNSRKFTKISRIF